MNFFQPKIYLSLLIFFLSICPNACLVEQAVAALANLVQHEHRDHHEKHEHDKSAPSHNHDKQGHENEFCCDNNLNFYLAGKSFLFLDAFEKNISSLDVSSLTSETANSVQYIIYLHRLKQPPTLRGRDKYALTCLLHAPPQI